MLEVVYLKDQSRMGPAVFLTSHIDIGKAGGEETRLRSISMISTGMECFVSGGFKVFDYVSQTAVRQCLRMRRFV